MNGPQHTERFSRIFTAFMVYCVLVWLWGLGLFMLWPWQKGGEWLPDYPVVVHCAGEQDCPIPVGKLDEARADGRLLALMPKDDTGETAYESITVQWKKVAGGMQVKASAWNFQTTVRYRIEDDRPVLLEYQEIGGKVFLYALLGALVSLGLLYLNKRRKAD
ncbi:MAG: hypothetical protein LWW83_00695 [Azonexaceae bacterium]|nr:hypothetical protein [Azonexaceae bacterium]